MEIADEILIETNNWAEQLRLLPVMEQCLIADKALYKTIRTTATRLQRSLPFKFKFKTDGDKVKVWKKNK